MKTHWGRFVLKLTLGLVTAAALGTAKGAEATAFELVKEGNKHIGEQSKDRVVQIRSEKSVGSVTPNIWTIVYYDEFATMKATEVKFGGGKLMAVKRPLRLVAAVTDKDSDFDPKRLKVDSDKALQTALAAEILKNLTVTASEMKMERYQESPVWKIKLWVAKIKNPKKDVEIGEIFVDAETGKVIKLDVKPQKAD